MDPDPHLIFRLDPDPHETDVDPKHWITELIITTQFDRVLTVRYPMLLRVSVLT
jgi:hypothetical protein